MENASKALIMAGSVLLAVLIIGSLVYMFNVLGSLKTEEANSDEVIKLAEYNKRILTFNRDLYGSELISLANLIQDYNERQSDLKGYEAIKLEVYMEDLNSTYMSRRYITNDSYKDLINDFNNMQNQAEYAKSTTAYGVSISDWYGMTDLEKEVYLQNNYTNTSSRNSARTYLNSQSGTYAILRADLNNFKNRKFEPIDFDDTSGRVTKITFKIIPI